MAETRSHIREKPLHVPGQSIDETINRVWDDRGVHYILLFSVFTCAAAYDWYRTITKIPTQPWITTAVALAVTVYCLWGLLRLRKLTKQLEQGRDGERLVAEALDTLREEGGRVFHDIIADEFNVDHVVVSIRQ